MSDQTLFQKPFIVGLPSWTIQDGNYEDFRQGDQASFALEFHAQPELTAAEAGRRSVEIELAHGSTYRIAARVLHVREIEWWAIDAGIRMYRRGRPPSGVVEGSWVSGEAYIGVDPFEYKDRHSRHHTAPALIYDWIIHKIELNTAPYIQVAAGLKRDPAKSSWREIERTNAWKDGAPADYLLHCELLNNPPRR
jgi:hypothetical protein